MKKKFILFMLLCATILSFSACKTQTINLGDYIIEERNNLFTASDDLYFATLSTGMRENDYAFDGVVNDKTEFGILTFSKLDKTPLANDTYTYVITIGDQNITGFLEKSEHDNTYSADIEQIIDDNAEITLNITFTGYNFSNTMTNTSNNFTVDKTTAVNLAQKEIKTDIDNLTKDKNNKIEVVIKILKDYSNGENYFWYVGVVSTNGETLGVLINAHTGDIIAKKV